MRMCESSGLPLQGHIHPLTNTSKSLTNLTSILHNMKLKSPHPKNYSIITMTNGEQYLVKTDGFVTNAQVGPYFTPYRYANGEVSY